MNRFICHNDNMWEDPWTYGDWRQYLCKLEDESIVCARRSAIPTFLAVIGFLVTLIGVLHTILVNDLTSGLTVLTGWLILLFPMWLGLTKNALMTPVGPKQTNGLRIFPWRHHTLALDHSKAKDRYESVRDKFIKEALET